MIVLVHESSEIYEHKTNYHHIKTTSFFYLVREIEEVLRETEKIKV